MKELSNEAREARNKYMREWRKKNPDKQKEYERRHWEKLAEKMQEEEK